LSADLKGSMTASFRDPSGFVVEDCGVYKRVITPIGAADYDFLMESGLARSLFCDGLLLEHEELSAGTPGWPDAHRVLLPTQLDFVSYPYEWSFSQLKDAALLTLDVQERALEHSMSLKDASAFNVQFHYGRPVFIDTLSFERDDGRPWVAYEQFCRHFLAPLLLMQIRSLEMGRLLCANLDGIPIELASKLLGWRSYLRPGALVHLHLHARAQRRSAGSTNGREAKMSAGARIELIRSLRRTVENIRLTAATSAWSGYESQSTHYSQEALSSKLSFVLKTIQETPVGLVYDVGGNTGVYSRLAADCGNFCVLYDSDALCVERAYLREKQTGGTHVLPLRLDLSNPTPALGVNLRERASVLDRRRGRLVMALALVHHLRLRENIPFEMMADFFAQLGDRLLIEWVGPRDEMARPMLAAKKSPPCDYDLGSFLTAFSKRFWLRGQSQVTGMDRTMLVLECRNSTTS